VSRAPRTDFRRRLLAGDLLIGTFIRTPHASVVEVLGHSPLDCVCLDAEHAPFDRTALDAAILAARASSLPALVRIHEPAEVLTALDLGATGVLVPHVSSLDIARRAALSARYVPGGRGYAGSTRAAGYTTRSMTEIIDEANRTVAVIAQIEDAAALEHLDAIASVEGLDALFIGRNDLTVSLGARSPSDSQVVDAVRAIHSAAQRHKRPLGMFASTVEEAGQWAAKGVSFFLLASDQQCMLQGVRDLVAGMRGR